MKITINIPVTMTTAVSNIVGNLCIVNVKNVVMAKNFKAVTTQVVEIALGARKSQIVLCVGFFLFHVVENTFCNFIGPVLLDPIPHAMLRVFIAAGHRESVEFSHVASVKYLSFVLHQSQAQHCSCAW